MKLDKFIEIHPKLFHVAHSDSFMSIQKFGLLSTKALLDLYEITNYERSILLSQHRPESVTIAHPSFGAAVIRDQKPMFVSALQRCLTDNLKPSDWFEILNSKVFFWTTSSRMLRFLNARPYRNMQHLVLTFDTQKILELLQTTAYISPYNSGATLYNPVSRGYSTFLPVSEFPFDLWASRGRRVDDICVEFVVDHGVANIMYALKSAQICQGDAVISRIC